MNKSRPNSDPTILGTRPIGRLLMQYSVPAVIASVVTSLYNIIDSIFIGRGVGAMAIAGLAITFPLMNLVIAFCMLIAVGGATITSIFMGQKKYSACLGGSQQCAGALPCALADIRWHHACVSRSDTCVFRGYARDVAIRS